jgi:hypothetical protein
MSNELTAENLKGALWDTLKDVRSGKSGAQDADAVATQAREILRTVKTQLDICRLAKRDVPAEVIKFNG